MIEKVASFDIVVNLFASTGAAKEEGITGYDVLATGITAGVIALIFLAAAILYLCDKKPRQQSDTTSQHELEKKPLD